jgi:glycosyltransferase involved in cell wall biosynthesis
MAIAILRGPYGPASARVRDETGETAPRTYLFDEQFAPRYDESILRPEGDGPLSRRMPPWLRLALEVQRRQDEYDVVVTWGDRLSLALMGVQALAGAPKPHIAMMYWFSKANVRLPMRAFGSSLHAIVTWSSVQRAYAVQELGFRAEKVHLVKHFVDHRYWASEPGATDLIVAAGKEMRDYPTLLEALRGTNLPCHIATDHVRIPRLLGLRHARVSAARLLKVGGPVTLRPMSVTEMRRLYARARFVVVPLRPSDTDNGVNVILEAMAMGKPVICSRTRGQVDVIEDGVTGLFVPVGDAAALRAAMLSLWNDPARAREMGARARAHVVQHHTLEQFCESVTGAVRAAVGAPREPSPVGSTSQTSRVA